MELLKFVLCCVLLVSTANGFVTVQNRKNISSKTASKFCRLGCTELKFSRKDENLFYDSEDESERVEELIPRKRKGSAKSKKKNGLLFTRVPKALIAGIFVLGIGTGVTLDSAINANPKDLASRDAIDRNAPNPLICQTYGSSAMVVDERVFVTFNPFAIFVAQADVKPGCVLRPSNYVEVLKTRKLINQAEVEACKNGMNTWAFVGDLNGKPQLSCVYPSDDAQNEFLSDPKIGLGEDVYDDDRVEEMMGKATGMRVGGK